MDIFACPEPEFFLNIKKKIKLQLCLLNLFLRLIFKSLPSLTSFIIRFSWHTYPSSMLVQAKQIRHIATGRPVNVSGIVTMSIPPTTGPGQDRAY